MFGAERIAYLYAFDGMADWEYGFLAAELNSGRYFKDRGTRIELKAAALGPGPVRTMGGLRLVPDILIDEIEASACSLLILPGGDGWLDPIHAPVVEKARAFLDAGLPVAAICGATFALAQAGLLDDRVHTSNDLGYLKAVCPAYRGEALYSLVPAVSDRGLITANGIAPVEFTRCVLDCLGLATQETLDAWFGLFTAHDPEYYGRLMSSLPRASIVDA